MRSIATCKEGVKCQGYYKDCNIGIVKCVTEVQQEV